jgi:hypothetical protein
MHRFTLVSLPASAALLVALAACAKGSPDSVIDNRGGGTPIGNGGTNSGGASSNGGSSNGGSGNGGSTGSSTASSSGPGSTTTTTSGGKVPTDCAEAYGVVGCCANNVAYFCKTNTSPLTAHQCTNGQVCGWEASKSYYYCVSPPGGADPSKQNPIACK